MARAWKILDFDPNGAVGHTVPRIALARFQETFFHEMSARGGSIDGVHDMRVSARRLQAVLNMFRKVFPRKQLRPVSRRIDDLVRFLGRVRELDVFLDVLRQHRQLLTPDETPALDLLIARQEHRRSIAFRRLESLFRRFEKEQFRLSAAAFFESLGRI